MAVVGGRRGWFRVLSGIGTRSEFGAGFGVIRIFEAGAEADTAGVRCPKLLCLRAPRAAHDTRAAAPFGRLRAQPRFPLNARHARRPYAKGPARLV